jgi:hypothetical protein
MPFRRTPTSSPVAEAGPTPAYDVMALRRVSDHPALQPLVQRRQTLVQRLQALEVDHTRLEVERRTLEHREAEQVAALGAEWNPAAYRELKHALNDNEDETATVRTGLDLLDQYIDEATSTTRDDIEAAFNRLRQPLLAQVIAALESIVDANRQIHAIEGLSQRLLQVGKYHLYDASLEPRLAQMQRTAYLMELGALGADAT